MRNGKRKHTPHEEHGKSLADKSLVEVAVAARKAGMSYGQYVAQEYGKLHPVKGGKRNAKNRKK